ncbi:DUF2290 domain-containing protein [Sporosarcina sp. Sa2YVA2]|uniref:DUF2290 domain-containing protein n=1 Tax=Sporosarcina quadrami TaxID=2762234 RepID=A0ABR8UDE2_9BACL|nr:DUF2290 domain-containing protein [Sporosarcina quadrami]MBD7985729.1 DUF2290 domain-containing protein [Sporosarcina quadrami]
MQKRPSEQLYKQFNVLKDMYKDKLILGYIEPTIHNNLFTFTNQMPIFDERSPLSAKYFNNCKQYLTLFKNRSYHFLFVDGSIAKFHYEFDELNKLISYNLLWYPCPFSEEWIKIFKLDDGSIDELQMSEFMDNIEEVDNFKYLDFNLRTPIRIDYDITYDAKSDKASFHPTSHIHFQHTNTRARNSEIFCLYKFFVFIIENCYPNINYELTKSSLISERMLNEASHWLKCKDLRTDGIGDRIYTTYTF